MNKFSPFQNDSQSVGLMSKAGELTLENQGGQVNLYGNVIFTLDKDSLDLAKQLQQVANDIVTFLEKNAADTISHEAIESAQQSNVSEVANPFG